MSVENNGASQADGTNPNEPQVGAENDNTPQAGANQSALTLEQALSELAKVRKEAASHRVKLNEFEEQARKAAEAQMTEAEKYKTRSADLERQLAEKTQAFQERVVNQEVRMYAASMGFVYPDVAATLLDWSQIEYSDDGSPKNVQQLLKNLLKDKPLLAGTPQAGSVANPPRNPQAMTFTNSQIGQMSPEEFEKNKAAIWQAQREGRILPG